METGKTNGISSHPRSPVQTFQVAGFDDLERGFTRQAELYVTKNGVHEARFRYETLLITAQNCQTWELALQNLIMQLHSRGYRQLRTRQQFQGRDYLGNQEEWVEHPDPDSNPAIPFLHRLRAWWNHLRRLE